MQESQTKTSPRYRKLAEGLSSSVVAIAVLACVSTFDKRMTSAEAAGGFFSGDSGSGRRGQAKSNADTSSSQHNTPNTNSAPVVDEVWVTYSPGDDDLLEFDATAYSLPGNTAAGVTTYKGTIAADPRILPLGSVVHISAGHYSGTYLVLDTGPRIKGRKIDIYIPDHREAMTFGRRSVRLKIIGRVHPRHLQPK